MTGLHLKEEYPVRSGIKPAEISVVIPVFNEVENIKPITASLLDILSPLNRSFEIIFVDDGSFDGTYKAIKTVLEENPYIKLIRLRRNYGQTAAVSAGFDHANGEIIITMDGDLQNDPADIPRLIEKIEEGYDVVSGWRKNRRDDFISRKIPSLLANKLVSKMSGLRLHDYGCSLKAYRYKIAKEVALYGELHRFIPILAYIEGASIIEIPVNHNARRFGKSKYNIFRAFKVVLDLMTLIFLEKFMTRPLHIFGRIGLFSFFAGLIINLYLVFQKIVFWLILVTDRFSCLELCLY